MAVFDEAAYYKTKAVSLSNELAARLDEFVNEFPAGSPYALIELLKLFLTGLESDLEVATDLAAFKNYCALINSLAIFLDLLDNAHTEQTPKGLVQLVDDLARTLFSKAVLFISPMSEYNYRIANLVPDFKRLASQVLSVSARAPFEARLPNALYLVRFPRVERDNILNHAVFGHEFGHPIAADFLAKHEQEPSFQARLTQARTKIESDPAIAPTLAAIVDPLTKSKTLSELVDRVASIHRRGIEEIVSDAVGIHLFGPSALFALLDILGQSGLDALPSHPEFYPPSRHRIRVMLSVLAQTGHTGALRALVTPDHLKPAKESVLAALAFAEAVAASNSDQQHVQADALTRIAYEWLAETLPDALNDAQARAAPAAYKASSLAAEIVPLLERLLIEVPPNEIGQWPSYATVDWRSSLLSAWMLHFSHVADSSLTTASRKKTVAVTRRLASAGVEYAVLARRYKQYLAAGHTP